MRPITFVCGTPHGGALDSTRALAEAARAAGHPTKLVVISGDPYVLWARTSAAFEKMRRVAPSVAWVAWRAFDLASGGRRPRELEEVRSSNLAGTLRRILRGDELVVVNSLRALDLRRVSEVAHRAGVPIAWYLREESSLATLPKHVAQVDVIVANSLPLARQAAEIAGRPCPYVPSVITVEDLEEPADRSSVLLVNPVATHGVDDVLGIAALLPDRKFVLQESWPLAEEELRTLRQRLERTPNVELRRRTDRSRIYRDAGILLAPYGAETIGLNRPRVALECQHLGIPLIASATEGLSAVAASSDLLIEVGSTPARWVAAIRAVEAEYTRYAVEARAFASRELPSEEVIWQRFASACVPHFSSG